MVHNNNIVCDVIRLCIPDALTMLNVAYKLAT